MATQKAEGKDGIRKLTALVSAEERKMVREAAFLSDQSVAQFLRAAAVNAAKKVAKSTLGVMDKAA